MAASAAITESYDTKPGRVDIKILERMRTNNVTKYDYMISNRVKLTESFAFARKLVNIDFSTDHTPKWIEGCCQIRVS